MDPNLIPDILAVFFIVVPVFISLRAFYIYAQTHNDRLFILGLAMAVIALTAADNLFVNIEHITFNTYWFLYLGQTASFFFIWLSLLGNSDEYLRKLKGWHIVISALLIGLLLLLSPTLPAFPNTTVRAIVNATRIIPCIGIFGSYVSAFMKKETRFSFFMGLAFLLLAYGITITIFKYFSPNPDLFDSIGDITRLVGLITLLVAVFWG